MKVQMKKTAIAILAVIAAVLLLRIGFKIFQSSQKGKSGAMAVSTVKAQMAEIEQKVRMTGILEGDPQVKVFSKVPGKFEKNEVSEGDTVAADATLLFIDRDMTGFEFMPAAVKAPVAGIVTKLYYFDKGAMVMPQYPVAEVAAVERVKAELKAGQDTISILKKGLDAEISAAGVSITGKVYSVTPFIDTDTMAGTVMIKAENPGKVMKIGSSVSVTVTAGKRKAIMVPLKAVLTGEEQNYVYINEGGKAARVNVTTGYSESGMTELVSGVKEGDDIVTEGAFKLFEGAELAIK